MKFCDKCGAKMESDALFCPVCGSRFDTEEQTASANGQEYVRREEKADAKPPEKSSNALTYVLISAVATLVICLILLVVFLVVPSFNKGNAPASTEKIVNEVIISGDIDADKPKGTFFDSCRAVEEYANSIGNKYDISFAIYDEESGKTYESFSATDDYTAWGLYIPVYLAYISSSNYNNYVANNILSNDPGVCNANGNEAIESVGGLSALNRYISNYYNVRNTYYGRKFGDNNNVSDNYTSASEALQFLMEMERRDEAYMLDYSLEKFGISTPRGAKVNAHIGTENNSVRKDLNIFAVVEGDESEYCVVILTKNSNGVYISSILEKIHIEMEKLYED